ncbi:MAG: hypothetical protein KC910_30790, partial [Candidatus Eremiobacteraeota bacterium]|nr:hypothetical protein [Candidatus Eremiobacteraeota bacterium]
MNGQVTVTDAVNENEPKPKLAERARDIWATVSYGTQRPARLVLLLGVAGLVSGLGETAIIILLITMATGGQSAAGPLTGSLPTSTVALTVLSIGSVLVVSAAHWLSARTATKASAEVRENVQRRIIEAWFDAPWATQVSVQPAELQHLVGVDVTSIAIAARTASQALSSAFYLIVVVFAAGAIGPYTVVALGAAMFVSLALGRPVRSARRALVKDAAAAPRALALDVSELGGTTREVRVFGVVPRVVDHVNATSSRAAQEMQRYEYVGQLGAPLVRDATV